MSDRNAIAGCLLQFEKESAGRLDIKGSGKLIGSREGEGELDPTNDPTTHPLKFIFGLIFDQGIGWKTAWKGPSELEDRLGGLDSARIAGMKVDDLEKVMRKPKSLHRFPRKVAGWLIKGVAENPSRVRNGFSSGMGGQTPTPRPSE